MRNERRAQFDEHWIDFQSSTEYLKGLDLKMTNIDEMCTTGVDARVVGTLHTTFANRSYEHRVALRIVFGIDVDIALIKTLRKLASHERLVVFRHRPGLALAGTDRPTLALPKSGVRGRATEQRRTVQRVTLAGVRRAAHRHRGLALTGVGVQLEAAVHDGRVLFARPGPAHGRRALFFRRGRR